MIALTFAKFRSGGYDDKGEGHELYILKNGEGEVLYIGISRMNIWYRWFGSHISHYPMNIYGEYYPTSQAAKAIHKHRPESDNWIIELWTRYECLTFLSDNPQVARWDPELVPMNWIEALMIQKLEPSLNVIYVLPKNREENHAE